MTKYGFPKSEHLKHQKDIDLLFEKGKWRTHGKLRVVFLKVSDEKKTQVGVSVSKRTFKKAVDRNYVKRLLRECYRHHKCEFGEAFGPKTLAMIFWTGRERPKFHEVEQQFKEMCFQKRA